MLLKGSDANPNVRDNLFNSPTHAIRVGGLSDTTAFRTSVWRFTNIGDYKVLVVHGHTFYVYRGVERLKQYALQNSIDIVMFGHTHKPYIEIDEDVTILNRYLGSSSLRFVDLSNLQLALADYNQDGVVDSTDLTLIQNLVIP